MRNIIAINAAALFSCVLAIPSANAAELAMSSSGSASLTVIIPPVFGALAAQANGAVGLWTVQDDRSALMLKLPDQISDGEQPLAAVYRGKDMLFTASIAPNRYVTLTTENVNDFHGLTLQSFRVNRTLAPISDDAAPSVLMVISSI